MKVCYVTHKPNLTGASQSLLDMLSGWKDYDIEPVVLMPFHGPLEEALSSMGIRTKVIRYTTAVKTRTKAAIWRDPLRMAVNRLYSYGRIRSFFQEEKFDLIHNNSFLVGVGMQAALDLSIPYVCHLRDMVEEDHKLEYLNIEKQYELLKKSSKAIAISEYVFRKYNRIVPEANYVVLNNAINVEKYNQRHGRILSRERVNLLLPGRIAQGKCQMDAVKAIEIMCKRGYNNVHLKIIGNGDNTDYERRIHQYVRDNKIPNVTFLPFGDLKELRQEADIGLMCSSHEAMGRVTIESMLSGCLTIGANAGATPELIEDGVTGYLYKVGDPSALAQTIIKAVENKEEANIIANNGQSFAVENYCVKNYCSRIYDSYKEILREKKGRGEEVDD